MKVASLIYINRRNEGVEVTFFRPEASRSNYEQVEGNED